MIRLQSAEGMFLLFLLGTLPLFGAVIWWGLRARRALQKECLAMRAADLRPALCGPGADPASFLYALEQDFSNTISGYIVRDSNDAEIARISFPALRRKACILIRTTQGESFAADVLPTWRRRLRLRPDGDESEASTLCGYENFYSRSRYEAAGAGDFDIKRSLAAFLDGARPIERDGKAVGKRGPISRRIRKGVFLDLPASVPLPVRLFILALG
jgi:hypothetical protein